MSTAFAEAARFAATWTKQDPTQVAVEMNQDFVSTRLSPQEAEWALRALTSGNISYDTFWYILQTGEVVPASVDAETERERIENERPRVEGEPL